MARKPSDGSSAEETLLTHRRRRNFLVPKIDWSPDGRYSSHAVSIPIRGAGKIGFCLRLARANRFSALRWVAAVSMRELFVGRPLVSLFFR
jgi:hypothetical protein